MRFENYNWISIADKRKAISETPYTHKSYDGDAIDVEVNGNEVVATVSTDDLDADKEIVVPKGMDLDRFRKNPGVYLDHNTSSLPLGAAQWIKARAHDIVAKYTISAAASPEHATIATLVKDGAIKGHSLGFLSKPTAPTSQELRFHPTWENAKGIHRTGTLLEFSLTGFPCNENCTAIAVAKGCSKTFLDMISGKTAHTEEVAKEIVKEIASKKHLSKDDVLKIASKAIDSFGKTLDADALVQMALKAIALRQ